MNNPKCLICISYSEIWILNWFFRLNDGKIDWIGCRLQQNENSSAFWRWNIFRFPFCSDIIKYEFLVMFFLSGKWNIVILKLSPGRTISSNGWILHGKHHLHACHECRKNIFKEKNPRKKLWNSILKFSQRWENIHCKITFCNNTFGTIWNCWNYFLDWPHGTRFRIDTRTSSFIFHFVFIRRHFAHHSTFYFEA